MGLFIRTCSGIYYEVGTSFSTSKGRTVVGRYILLSEKYRSSTRAKRERQKEKKRYWCSRSIQQRCSNIISFITQRMNLLSTTTAMRMIAATSVENINTTINNNCLLPVVDINEQARYIYELEKIFFFTNKLRNLSRSIQKSFLILLINQLLWPRKKITIQKT